MRAAARCCCGRPPCRRADRGVAGFQAQRGAVDGDVGTRLVDDADDADGRATLRMTRPLGRRALELGADGVGQGDDFARPRPGGGCGLVEREAVEHGRGEAGGAAGLEVLGVGGDERRDGGLDLLGERGERAVLGLGRGDSQFNEAARAASASWRTVVARSVHRRCELKAPHAGGERGRAGGSVEGRIAVWCRLLAVSRANRLRVTGVSWWRSFQVSRISG